MKKLLALTLVICLATSPLAVSAQGNNDQKVNLKKEIFNGLKNSQMREKYKNTVVPTKQEIKKILTNEFSKDPIANKENFKKIDELSEQFVEFFTVVKEYDLSTQDFRWYPHWHTWATGDPKLTGTSRTKHYGPIQEYDNRTSPLKVEMKFSTKISATVSVGFSGSADIKDALSLSVNANGSYTYEQTVEEKVVIPAYTYWSRQAYAYKKTNTYTGTQITWTLVNNGTITNPVMVPQITETSTQTATNSDGDGGGVEYK